MFRQQRPSNLINERMQLLKVILTGGHVHDSAPAVALLKGIKINVKKFSRIKLTVASKFAFSSLSTVPLLVSPIKPISRLSMTLIQSFTSTAISLSGSFNASRTFATLPLVSINWLCALKISFYLLLVLFTFNLPTTPSS